MSNDDASEGTQTPMAIRDRLYLARKKAGLSQVELARLATKDGYTCTQSYVSKLEREADEQTRISVLPGIARACGVDLVWLTTGRGHPGMRGTVPERGGLISDVPLLGPISHLRREMIAEPQNYATETVTTRERHAAGAFALRVDTDAMTVASGLPTYPEGALIVVDPAEVVEMGNRVVAMRGDVVIFKQLVEDAGIVFFRSLNRSYPHIEKRETDVVIGAVVETILEQDR